MRKSRGAERPIEDTSIEESIPGEAGLWRGALFFVHISLMIDRPCKPDADLKRLWQILLPSTPFPACGPPANSSAPAGDNARPATELIDAATPHSKCGPHGRSGLGPQPCSFGSHGDVLERIRTLGDSLRGAEYAFGTQPNYFLASCEALLPQSGRVLAVADGEGRNGVWLAEQGLDVMSIDFSPSAQKKVHALALYRHVNVAFQQTDVHSWNYPQAAFDVVVEISTQFSSPAERDLKWAGMRRALKPGGLLIIHGYTPNQLKYGTGGPKQVENLYPRLMLEKHFPIFAR